MSLRYATLALAVASCTRAATVSPADADIGVRNAHVLAYDARNSRVLLFGGADDRSVVGETWSWDGSRWRKLATSGPLPRTFAAVAHDPTNQLVFVYGGNRALFGRGQPGDTLLSDFWRWDGVRWTQIASDGPGARAEAALAYDSARRKLVLFGGYRGFGPQRVRLGDTWEWDGDRWRLVRESGPSPRNNAAMVYDPDRNVTVLFGGSDGTASGETWEWNGATWRRSDAPLVEPRYNPVMTYDRVSSRILRFGGWNGRERTSDTWAFDGRTWTLLTEEGPRARNHSALAFDARRGRAVLFGGHDGPNVFGDTWEWTGNRWTLIDSVPARPRLENGH